MGNLSNIRSPVFFYSKKMKHCAVVPDVVGPALKLNFRNIGGEPADPFCGQSQPFLCHADSRLRNIKDGDVLITPRKKIIDEGRFAAANINDGCRISGSRAL